jgi:hypothetical protein
MQQLASACSHRTDRRNRRIISGLSLWAKEFLVRTIFRETAHASTSVRFVRRCRRAHACCDQVERGAKEDVSATSKKDAVGIKLVAILEDVSCRNHDKAKLS